MSTAPMFGVAFRLGDGGRLMPHDDAFTNPRGLPLAPDSSQPESSESDSPASGSPASGSPAPDSPAPDSPAQATTAPAAQRPYARHGTMRQPRLPPLDLPPPRPQDAAAVLALLVLVLFNVQVPFLRPVLGLWVMLGLPVRLLLAKLTWRSQIFAERVVHAVAGVLLALIVGGLGLNTLGPLLGVDRPLDPLPVVLLLVLAVTGLSMWRQDRLPARWLPARGLLARGLPGRRLHACWTAARPAARALTVTGVRVPWPPLDTAIVVLSGLAVLLAIGGANRLNNSGSSLPAMAALILVLLIWALLLRFRGQVHELTIAASVYLVSLTLLLGTSLRGWHVTGHDIQREYRVFEVTLAAGRWSSGTFHNAYNACLSITVLPTVFQQILHLDPPYVYKLIFQLIFAITPVGVYLLARRTSSVGTALLGVLFFVGFPTFFTDMPFLDRQEIAFVFLVAALLAVTQHGVAVSHRRLVFGWFAVGVVLSHYSTAYILIGVTALAGLMRMALVHGESRIPKRMRWLNRRVDDSGPQPKRTRTVVTLSSVLLLLAMAAIWSGALTHSGGQLAETLRGSFTEVLHPGSSDAKSSDTAYNLLPSPPVPPQQRLDDYQQTVFAGTATARSQADSDLLSRRTLARYPLTVVGQDSLPLTPLGAAMHHLGLDPGFINATIRQAAAKLLQVFVLVGLLALAFGYRQRFKPTGEIVLLGVASFAVVVSQVVLPQVSADYGVLRAFQQALMILAPFLATGLLICFRWARARSDALATIFALAFLTSLIGVLPQLTGGYPPQLQLNNAGTYYDVYYTRTPELAALGWLAGVPQARDNVQFTTATDRLTTPQLESYLGSSPDQDIFPPYLNRGSFVLLDATVVTKGIGMLAVSGDTLGYRYPTELLDRTRNLVYSNGFSKVYR